MQWNLPTTDTPRFARNCPLSAAVRHVEMALKTDVQVVFAKVPKYILNVGIYCAKMASVTSLLWLKRKQEKPWEPWLNGTLEILEKILISLSMSEKYRRNVLKVKYPIILSLFWAFRETSKCHNPFSGSH